MDFNKLVKQRGVKRIHAKNSRHHTSLSVVQWDMEGVDQHSLELLPVLTAEHLQELGLPDVVCITNLEFQVKLDLETLAQDNCCFLRQSHDNKQQYSQIQTRNLVLNKDSDIVQHELDKRNRLVMVRVAFDDYNFLVCLVNIQEEDRKEELYLDIKDRMYNRLLQMPSDSCVILLGKLGIEPQDPNLTHILTHKFNMQNCYSSNQQTRIKDNHYKNQAQDQETTEFLKSQSIPSDLTTHTKNKKDIEFDNEFQALDYIIVQENGILNAQLNEIDFDKYYKSDLTNYPFKTLSIYADIAIYDFVI